MLIWFGTLLCHLICCLFLCPRHTLKIVITFWYDRGFPSGSAGKESGCNAGDLGSIPGLGDPLEKGKATHSIILPWRIPWTVHGVAKSWTRSSDFHFHSVFLPLLISSASVRSIPFLSFIEPIFA